MRLDVYRSYGYDKGIIFDAEYRFGYNNINQELTDQLIESIRSIDGVETAEYLDSSTSVIALNDENCIYLMSLPSKDSCPWPLITGTMPDRDSNNEICLSSNFIGKYRVGDVISCEVLYGTNETLKQLCNLRVTGFFNENSYMPVDGGDTFKYELSSWANNTVAYAACASLVSQTGEKIAFDKDFEHIFVLPEKSSEIESLKIDIIRTAGRGKALDYNDYKLACYNDNKEVNDMIKLFFVAFLVLVISVLSSYTIIQLSVNRGELITYYLNGCTWKKTVAITCFATLPMLLIGLVIGVFMYKNVPIFLWMTNGSYLFDLRLVFLFCCSVILLYFLLTTCFYFATFKQSPLESLRSE